VPAAIEFAKALDPRIDRCEVPPEAPHMGHRAANGRIRVRSLEPLDVGDEAREDPCRNPGLGQTRLEGLALAGRAQHRRAIEDPEVVESGACGEQNPPVMSRRPMGALVPLAEGDLELFEILGAQSSERLAGPDQHTCRDEAARAPGDGVGEPELASSRNEPLHVIA